MDGDALATGAIAIVGGVIGLAVISVLVSRQAQTPTVLSAAGSALANVVNAAVSPVTGATASTGGGGNLNSSLALFNATNGNLFSILGN